MVSNGLYRIAAVSAVAVGVFLLLGASGHFAAIWDRLDDPGVARWALLSPGLVLASTGAINIVLSQSLWNARRWSQRIALATNVVAAGYLAWLLSKGVPDHPIGLFLAIVMAHVIILIAIAAGLVWPIRSQEKNATR